MVGVALQVCLNGAIDGFQHRDNEIFFRRMSCEAFHIESAGKIAKVNLVIIHGLNKVTLEIRGYCSLRRGKGSAGMIRVVKGENVYRVLPGSVDHISHKRISAKVVSIPECFRHAILDRYSQGRNKCGHGFLGSKPGPVEIIGNSLVIFPRRDLVKQFLPNIGFVNGSEARRISAIADLPGIISGCVLDINIDFLQNGSELKRFLYKRVAHGIVPDPAGYDGSSDPIHKSTGE